MQQAVHPAYGPALFRDRAADTMFPTRSTIVGRLEADHPRLTWEDGESVGRVESFERRYGSGRKTA